ncbi:hypothetical protein N9544_07185 [Flavobacteriales bacterium]|nr:hypothetical protein [Flavobacteriales bacterium]
MKRNYIKTLFIATVFGLGISSCSVATETVEVEVAKQTLAFEYITEGGNEMAVTLNVAEMLGSGIDVENIETATIKSITVMKNDSIGFSEINEAKLQLMGESEDLTMVTVGISDSIVATDKEIVLSIMDEVEVAKYLKEENLTIVLDLTYLKDQDLLQTYEVGIKFDLEMNEQK